MEMQIRKASAEAKHAAARAMNPALFDRVMSRIDVRSCIECWPSIKPTNHDGYGIIKIGDRSIGMHRVMFRLYYPNVPTVVVRHICNNPVCANPAHLRPGTQKDNAIDRMNSGRGGDLRGEKNGRSKLTDEQVRAIRASNKSGSEIGREYGISKVMACRIRRGLAWAHVE